MAQLKTLSNFFFPRWWWFRSYRLRAKKNRWNNSVSKGVDDREWALDRKIGAITRASVIGRSAGSRLAIKPLWSCHVASRRKQILFDFTRDNARNEIMRGEEQPRRSCTSHLFVYIKRDSWLATFLEWKKGLVANAACRESYVTHTRGCKCDSRVHATTVLNQTCFLPMWMQYNGDIII